MNKLIPALLAAAVVALAAPASWAAGEAPAKAGASTESLTAGEVRKVDLAGAKLTIKHEPIKNLDMGAMTMVFKADKPDLLKGLKAGDKIRFQAESRSGALIVTKVEKAK